MNVSSCFWGAATPAVPAYVELTVSRTSNGIAVYEFAAGCTVTSVAGLGAEAKGATCPADPQRKV